MEPLVSIIIPTYNRSHFLGETLDSVLLQTYTSWECIVVDDGSSDYTDELMEFYLRKGPKIKYCHRPEEEPKGASMCRNIGLSKAKGKYCIFLDSDDLLLDSCLQNRIDAMNHNPGRNFWVFPMLVQNEKQGRKRKEIPSQISYLEEFLSYKFHWQTMCTFWEITYLKSLGGFNPAYPRLNDPEIHIRAILKSNSNYKVFPESKPDTIYRMDLEVKQTSEVASRYYQSLILFIPDIANKLKINKRESLVPLLKAYLRDYMKFYYSQNSRKKNKILFKLCYGNGVISYPEYLELTTFYDILLGVHLLQKKAKGRINHALSD